jgi:hypothetical protein
MKKSINNQKRYLDFESNNFSHLGLRDIVQIDQQGWFIINDDGSIAKIFKLQGIDSSTFIDSDYANVFKALSELFSGAPRDITVTTSFFKKKAKELPALPVIASMEAKASRAFYNKLREDGECYDIEIYLSVNIYPKFDKQPFKEKVKSSYKRLEQFIKKTTDTSFLSKKFEGVVDRARTVNEFAGVMKQSLTSVGIGIEEIEGRVNLSNLFVQYFRQNTSSLKSFDIKPDGRSEDTSLREQILDGLNVKEVPFGINMENYFNRIYQIDEIESNEEITGGEIKDILKAPFELDYHIVFRNMDNEEGFKEMKNAKRWARFVAGDEKELEDDPRKQKELETVEENFHETALSRNGVVKMTAFMNIRISNGNLRKNAKRENLTTKDYVKKMDYFLESNFFSKFCNSKWRAVRYGQYPLFCDLAFGQFSIHSKMYDYFIQLVDACVTMFPIWEQRSVDDHGYINHFYSEEGTIFPYDSLSPSLSSWSMYCTGPMGSGKSILLNKVISFMEETVLKTGNLDSILVRGIDYAGPAGSFFTRIEMMGGQIIKFNGVQKPKFNPLSLDDLTQRPKKEKKMKIRKYLMNIFPDRFGHLFDTYEEYSSKFKRVSELENEIRVLEREISEVKSDVEKDLLRVKVTSLDNLLREEREVYHKIERKLDEEEREVDLYIEAYYNKFSLLETNLTRDAKVEIFNEIFEVENGADHIEQLDLLPGEVIPNLNGENFILKIFEIFLSSNPDNGLDGFRLFDRDEIAYFIKETYERVDDGFPIISDVIDTIEAQARKRGATNAVESLIRKLSRYSVKRGGVYDSFDTKRGDIDTSNRAILFDLYGLEEDPALEKLYTIIIMKIISRDTYYNQDKKRFIMADEIHKTMDGGLLPFLEEFVRIARKYQAILGLASQNLFDLQRISPTQGDAILGLITQFFIAGVADANDRKRIASYFELTPSSAHALTKVGLRRDPFSKNKKVFNNFFLLSKVKESEKEKCVLLQNVMCSTEIAISSSDKSDNFIKKYLEKNMKMLKEDAVYIFAKEWLFKDDHKLMSHLRVDDKAHKIVSNFNNTGYDICEFFYKVRGLDYLESIEKVFNREVYQDDHELLDYLSEKRDERIQKLKTLKKLESRFETSPDENLSNEIFNIKAEIGFSKVSEINSHYEEILGKINSFRKTGYKSA